MKQVVGSAPAQSPAIRADEVREIRYTLGQSQSEFALMIGVSLATLQAWADGKHSPDGARIVADATLHRRARGPLRLVGRIKWMIDPAFRGAGLGTTLVSDFITIARERGLRHLNCMLISDLEADAVTTLRGLGFQSYVMRQYGTDPDGNQHDMTKLILRL